MQNIRPISLESLADLLENDQFAEITSNHVANTGMHVRHGTHKALGETTIISTAIGTEGILITERPYFSAQP